MGIVKEDVIYAHLSSHKEQEEFIRPFLNGFDINWARERISHNTRLSVYFLGPEAYFSSQFGFEQEVALFVSDYLSLEPRAMQAVDAIMSDDPAKGRVDPTTFIIISRDQDAKEWISNYLFSNPQTRIPVVFTVDELVSNRSNQWYVRNELSKQLFSRDLFDYQLPLENDYYFFGRDQLLAENLDAIKQSQNRGFFGLRKTGKTSILYKIKRTIESTGTGSCFYYDCKLPSIRMLSWNELLEKIIIDISKRYGINIKKRRLFEEKRIADTFLRVVKSCPNDQTLLLIFDEIEYISPKAILDIHWRRDFINLWQTIWSGQSQVRRLSTFIAGVNPYVVEIDSIDGVQNPMFGIVKPQFVRGLEPNEVRSLVRSLGKKTGMKFSDEAASYLSGRYGGHPLLTRLACSHTKRYLEETKAERPFLVSDKLLAENEEERDRELVYYCRHVVSELQQFYPDEYLMLEYLASGREADFLEFSGDPEFFKHIVDYGLVKIDKVGKPSFALPVVQKYISTEIARRDHRKDAIYIVPKDERARWIERRALSIISEMRTLETIAERSGVSSIYGGNPFSETDRFKSIQPAADRDQFVSFINICFRCLVEPIEHYGERIGFPKYYWETIRETYPELWDSLQRVRIYRHNDMHLKLSESAQMEMKRYLKKDLDGQNPDDIEDGWATLQQRVLDNLLVGIQIEINRYS